MAKKEGAIEVEGRVIEPLPNAMFRIELENGHKAVSYTHLTLPTILLV